MNPRLVGELHEPLAHTSVAEEAAALLAALVARRMTSLDTWDAGRVSRALELVGAWRGQG